MNTQRNTTSQKKLRRLAYRVQAVMARHVESSPQLRSLEQKLIAALTRFTTLYDQAKRDQALSQRMLVEARQKIATLREVLGKWRGPLERDLRDGATITLGLDVPEDLLVEAKRAIELVEASASDGSFADAQQVLDDVRPAFEDADASWIAAQAKLAERQDQSAEVRAVARAFEVELLVLRRTLRAVLGANHRDYQKLKANRTTPDRDDEDTLLDAAVESEPPAEPSADGNAPPVAA